ncbi:hypothetical protein KP509_22G033100 [Ceratopteris richardii]|nr:hypothetical protein KP509_22G033100 [Ceratopteris richardii]
MVPDLELVFGCGDRPEISKNAYQDSPPPPIFRYCTTSEHFDIPFPDWSFWGWPEVNIQPWHSEQQRIQKASRETPWKRRIPKAFWKGNLFMGNGTRMKLKECSEDVAEISGQDWNKEVRSGFRHSKLSEQCKHRYKIYVEGIGWSVSLKYILACASPVLLVQPQYYEFLARGLLAGKHFWDIPATDDMCRKISSAVEWGNQHPNEAMEIGRQGARFVEEEVSMPHVYDYMLHLLWKYAELLDFEPVIGDHLLELCPEAFLCTAPSKEEPFFRASMVHEPSTTLPCSFMDAVSDQTQWHSQ